MWEFLFPGEGIIWWKWIDSHCFHLAVIRLGIPQIQPPIRNLPLAKIVQGNPSQIFFDNVNIWTMETFEMESRQVDFGRIESDLYYEMGKIKGTIKNLTSYPWNTL